MDDFISLSSKTTEAEEFDILKLTPDPDRVVPPKPCPSIVENKPKNVVKPFYPTCKRVMTRPPFPEKPKKATSPLLSHSTKTEAPKSSCVANTKSPSMKQSSTSVNQSSPKQSSPSPKHSSPNPMKSPACSVGQISLDELMSVEDNRKSPEKLQKTAVDTDDRLVRLRNMLKQAEAEKLMLQGYVADLQAKLSAVPRRNGVKCSETQTDENGVKCPMCTSAVEPHLLLKSFGSDFAYDYQRKKFIHKSSGFSYDPETQLYHCEDNDVLYYWDTVNNVYHYHSKRVSHDEKSSCDVTDTSVVPNTEKNEKDEEEEEEEEGELTEEQTVTEELQDAANNALKDSGIEFIASMNMHFNKNTGLYYCQSSGLYYDTKMSVFYTLQEGKYIYHSTAKPDDIKSAYAKTCIRAIVKETSCHKVNAGMLFIFTCMGGSIGREGNHVAVFPEIRVSKRHATITYCADRYYITDEGTMNGTFLNNTRLSPQKEVSERFELSHLDELRVGSTTLQLHIHANQDTCNWCEPGLNTGTVPAAVATTISTPPTLYNRGKREVNRLKRKYNIRDSQ